MTELLLEKANILQNTQKSVQSQRVFFKKPPVKTVVNNKGPSQNKLLSERKNNSCDDLQIKLQLDDDNDDKNSRILPEKDETELEVAARESKESVLEQ